MTNTWQWLRKTVIIGFWLCLWQAAAFFIDNNIILVGPVEVFRCLAGLLFLPDFWKKPKSTEYIFGICGLLIFLITTL